MKYQPNVYLVRAVSFSAQRVSGNLDQYSLARRVLHLCTFQRAILQAQLQNCGKMFEWQEDIAKAVLFSVALSFCWCAVCAAHDTMFAAWSEKFVEYSWFAAVFHALMAGDGFEIVVPASFVWPPLDDMQRSFPFPLTTK